MVAREPNDPKLTDAPVSRTCAAEVAHESASCAKSGAERASSVQRMVRFLAVHAAKFVAILAIKSRDLAFSSVKLGGKRLMAIDNSGLLYYLNLLGIPQETLLVHYRFTDSGRVSNSADNYPQSSGILSSVGSFFNQPGSGTFTGQSLTIADSTGFNTNAWSHIAIIERTTKTGSVVFSNLVTGSPPSGYSWGFNDANKLFFEAEGQNGPICLTSSIILGKKNVVGVIYNGSNVSFCSYDFNNQESLWEEKSPNSYLFTARPTGAIGAPSVPAYAERRPFFGAIDDYVVFNAALSPVVFRYICSGLVSNYTRYAGSVTTINENVITGYASVLTGTTGVIGYDKAISGSGISPFGTGSYDTCWEATPRIGYITSGYAAVPLTGYKITLITGDAIRSVVPDSGKIATFVLDQVSLTRRLDAADFAEIHYLPNGTRANFVAGFDSVRGDFQLDSSYPEPAVHLFINGLSQLSAGYSITGNGFVSGAVLSGDYRLNADYVDSTGHYDLDDFCIYDIISGRRGHFYDTNIQTGAALSWKPSGNLVFLGGQLLSSGIDYTTNGAGELVWRKSAYIGASGLLTSFQDTDFRRETGAAVPAFSPPFMRSTSRAFLNGQRQRMGVDYLENSTLDLINVSGVLENRGATIYNNESGYFE